MIVILLDSSVSVFILCIMQIGVSMSVLQPGLAIENIYPHAFFKSEGDIVIASVRLSVRPSVRYAISS